MSLSGSGAYFAGRSLIFCAAQRFWAGFIPGRADRIRKLRFASEEQTADNVFGRPRANGRDADGRIFLDLGAEV